jgi:hypothetical protein
MSVIKFELKEEHVKLLKNLRWSVNQEGHIAGIGHDGVEYNEPFGEDDMYEAIDIILNGRPADFDPFNTEEKVKYTDEQKEAWDNLYHELPTALDVVLYNGSYELGLYKTKWHLRNWVKIN